MQFEITNLNKFHKGHWYVIIFAIYHAKIEPALDCFIDQLFIWDHLSAPPELAREARFGRQNFEVINAMLANKGLGLRA